MCIECWWECLNKLQQTGIVVGAIALYSHVVAQVIMWVGCCKDWGDAYAIPIAVLVGVAIVALFWYIVLYGIYGVIAWMVG